MKVDYHRGVRQDLRNYYEDASPGLGDQFFEEFLQVIAGIQQNPRGWGFGTHGRRVALFRRFPYKLIYREEPSGSESLW